MNKIFVFCILLGCFMAMGCSTNDLPDKQVVNSVLGDASFLVSFGRNPETADEKLRVSTHLNYVLKLLRKAPIDKLSDDLKGRRLEMLAYLEEYTVIGDFPVNYAFPNERKPCFIDRENRICAVGYLLAKSAGWQAAEAINAKFQYHQILDIVDSSLDNWIAQSGLSKLECAMIQPNYSAPPTSNNGYISAQYGLPSAMLTGANIAMMTTNGVQIFQGAKNDFIAVTGMLTGTSQLVLGAVNLDKDLIIDSSGISRNQSKNVLSYVNIGIGAAALTFSTINLFVKKKPADPTTAWNIYSYPAADGSQGVALAFTKRF